MKVKAKVTSYYGGTLVFYPELSLPNENGEVAIVSGLIENSKIKSEDLPTKKQCYGLIHARIYYDGQIDIRWCQQEITLDIPLKDIEKETEAVAQDYFLRIPQDTKDKAKSESGLGRPFGQQFVPKCSPEEIPDWVTS